MQHAGGCDYLEDFDVNAAHLTENFADGKTMENTNGVDNEVQGAEARETAGNDTEQRKSMDALVAQAQALGMYDVPSRRLSILVEGRDYLKYRETFERLLFSEKMTPAHKDAAILKLAMACLTEKMDTVSAATGEPFVKAEMLAG